MWVCSDCAWKKKPENPNAATGNTIDLFAKHECEGYPAKPKKKGFRFDFG